MAMELNNLTMEGFMKEIGTMVKSGVMAIKFGRIMKHIKEVGKKTCDMEKENKLMKMEMFTMETGKRVKDTDLEF